MGPGARLSTLFCILFLSRFAISEPAWTSGTEDTPAAGDGTSAVSRGYIVPTVEEIDNTSAKVLVDIYHSKMSSAVTLQLQAVIDDGTGKIYCGCL